MHLSALHEGPKAYNLVSLALAEIENHRFASPFGSNVDLGGEAALRVA
jgi:hypothetical protein